MRSASGSLPRSAAPATPRRRLIDGFSRGLARLDVGSPRTAYVLRSVLAAWLALTLAYVLELETPYSAASTVLLVIHPVQGAVIGKGTWRVLGTLVGMVVAVLLMSAFAQMPWLFLLGFGLWLGLCVAGMTLLRHFRASGTVVAGYTVGLATFGALQHPQSTFEHVVGRGSTVLLGVVCLGLVCALFSRRDVRSRLESLLGRLASATADVLASQHEALGEAGARPASRVAPARRHLIADIYGVDDLLALGQAESADLAQRATTVRHAMASLFAALVGGTPPLQPHSPSAQALRTLQPMLEQSWREASRALAQGTGGTAPALKVLRQARERLTEGLATIVLHETDQEAALLITGDRLVEQLDDYLEALAGIAALHRPRTQGTKSSLRFHRDTTAALQNGLRAMLTLVLAGAFWIVTGWPQGDMMLLVLAPYCALLATAGNPAAGAAQFVKGTVVAVPAAFLCAFCVLPHISGLPLLLIVLGLFWLPGIYATTLPQHGLAGLAYLVGFNTLTAAGNPMHADLGLFLNWSVAWVLATLFTLLSFRLLLPRNLARDTQRLRLRVRDEAVAVLRGAQVDRHVWQQRQQHRMAQLGALLKAQPDAMDHAIGDALASVHLGREVLRMRQWLRSAPAASPLRLFVAETLQRIARRASAPAQAARHARRAVRSLGRAAGMGNGEALDARRLSAALTDIAELLEGHADYFSTSAGASVHAQ